MKRKCIIVGNPGEQGSDNYCAGVEKDLENYKTYLLSPLGGLWYQSEIVVLNKPQKTAFEVELNNIQTDEYFLFIFCGHGWYSTPMNSTIIQLNNTEEYDSDKIKRQGNAQMMILDCCRVKSDERIVAEVFKKVLGGLRPQLHPDDCRRYYDKEINESGNILIVMNGCSVNETAEDDSQSGGYFSCSLLTTVESLYEGASVDTSNKYRSLSAPIVFDKARGVVQKKTGNRQNPQIEKPRCEKYLPFGIIA